MVIMWSHFGSLLVIRWSANLYVYMDNMEDVVVIIQWRFCRVKLFVLFSCNCRFFYRHSKLHCCVWNGNKHWNQLYGSDLDAYHLGMRRKVPKETRKKREKDEFQRVVNLALLFLWLKNTKWKLLRLMTFFFEYILRLIARFGFFREGTFFCSHKKCLFGCGFFHGPFTFFVVVFSYTLGCVFRKVWNFDGM